MPSPLFTGLPAMRQNLLKTLSRSFELVSAPDYFRFSAATALLSTLTARNRLRSLSVWFVIEGLPQKLLQRGIVYAKATAGGFDHLFLRNLSPVNRQSVVKAELRDELALCPPVSFTERMNGVELAKVISASAGEVFEVTARQMPFALQFSACPVEARNNVLRECEGVAGFRDVHSAKVSSPFEHVLKDVAVDRLKVTCIEPALDRLVLQFNDPPGGGYRLEFAELPGVANIPQVPKDIRFGIDVRVHIGGREADPRRGPSPARSRHPRHTAERYLWLRPKAPAPPCERWQARSQLLFRALCVSDQGLLQPSGEPLNTFLFYQLAIGALDANPMSPSMANTLQVCCGGGRPFPLLQ